VKAESMKDGSQIMIKPRKDIKSIPVAMYILDSSKGIKNMAMESIFGMKLL
jgi:hypothetical protein